VALNVSDSARARGLRIDRDRLGVLLGGAPTVETVGHRGQGLGALVEAAIELISQQEPSLGRAPDGLRSVA